MFRIFTKSLRTGVVTSRYPAVSEQSPLGFRGKPLVEPAKCDACGLCVTACPSSALILQSQPADHQHELQVKLDHCIFCGACEECCPHGAIKLGQMFELAAKKRTAYVEKYQVSSLPKGGTQ